MMSAVIRSEGAEFKVLSVRPVSATLNHYCDTAIIMRALKYEIKSHKNKI